MMREVRDATTAILFFYTVINNLMYFGYYSQHLYCNILKPTKYCLTINVI